MKENELQYLSDKLQEKMKMQEDTYTQHKEWA